MFVTFLLALREGLEAALIVGILFGFLRKSGQMARGTTVWLGVLTAIALSVLLAIGINLIGAELEGTAEQLFEGTMMLLAVAILTWMIFWMRSQSHQLKDELESKLRAQLQSGARWGLFAMAFLAVFREGVETALLIGAAAFQTDAAAAIGGSVLGLLCAALLGYLIYAATIKLNLRAFFSVTSIALLIFAAGLLGHAVHEFQEAGVLPMLTAQTYDLSALLNQDSTLGQFLRTLIGYADAPSLLESLSYVAYWAAILWIMRLNTDNTHSANRTA